MVFSLYSCVSSFIFCVRAPSNLQNRKITAVFISVRAKVPLWLMNLNELLRDFSVYVEMRLPDVFAANELLVFDGF